MAAENNFQVNDVVVKPRGYPFDGTVVGTFTKLDGSPRVVVESDAIPGLLHIFAPGQLMHVTDLKTAATAPATTGTAAGLPSSSSSPAAEQSPAQRH